MNKFLLQFNLLLISFFTFSAGSFAQTDTSNIGKEFWVGYGHHQFMEAGGTNIQNMVLYLSSGSLAATVTVIMDSSDANPALWWKKTYNIPANTAIATDFIPKGTGNAAASGTDPNFDGRLYSATSSSGIFRGKAIHIESNVPIVAYAHIFGSASSGATMLMPVESWGGLYTSVNSKQSYASNCYSWAYVIAKYDNTVIEVTPTVKTRAQNVTGLLQGLTKTITLMKGQIYQVMGANTGSDANGNGGSSMEGFELTGTKIQSVLSPTGYIHPIAVFSGSSRTLNPQVCGSGGGENDIQQHFPRQAWGLKYLTAPASNSVNPSGFMTHLYKIVVTDPTTIVRRNGVLLTGLISGTYYSFESNTADYIEADKPVLVAQFISGGNSCLGGSGVGDPEMFYLSPISQSIKNAVFYRTTREGITVNYVTLVIPTNGLSSLAIDGSSAFDLNYTHPRLAGYSVVVKRWTAAQAQVKIQSDSAFIGITYGLGPVESYGYNLGTNVKAVNTPDASVVPPGFTGELPLPITLLEFSGMKRNGNVELNWLTTNQINFDRFEIERSANGIDFSLIGTVKANGLSIYDFSDRNAFQYFVSNKSLFYRLKLIDKDGKYSYSKVVSPNPFTDNFQIKINSETKGDAKINVKDNAGRMIWNNTATLVQGFNLIPVNQLNGLQKGLYIIEIELNGNKQYFKVMK